MRIRSSLLSLATLALCALPAAASRPVEHAVASVVSSPLDSSSIATTTSITRTHRMSTSASGNASQIREQLDRYQSQFGDSGPYLAAAKASRAAVDSLLDSQPDASSFSVSISETASESSASLTIQFSASGTVAKPAGGTASGTASSSTAAPSPSGTTSTSGTSNTSTALPESQPSGSATPSSPASSPAPAPSAPITGT